MDEPKNIESMINAASPEAQNLLKKILVLEKEKLYMGNPQGIIKDILNAFKKEIK